MRILSLIIVLCITFSRGDGQVSPAPAASFGVNFNGDDFFFGFDGGCYDTENDWRAYAGFEFRPFYNRVLVERGSNTFFQYREKKYLLTLGGEKTWFPFENENLKLGGFGVLETVYNFGTYKGTRKNPLPSFVILPKAGVALMIENATLIRTGYEFFNTRNEALSPHRFFLNITFLIK